MNAFSNGKKGGFFTMRNSARPSSGNEPGLMLAPLPNSRVLQNTSMSTCDSWVSWFAFTTTRMGGALKIS